MRIEAFEYTNKGGRDYNEDAVIHSIKGSSGIFAVADGLGGHQYGEVASSTACETLVEDWDGSFGCDLAEWLKNKLAMANQKILQIQNEKNATLKSTAVVLAIEEGRTAWANVGDSRLYYIHDDEIVSVTNDHSVAFKKYKAGEITREQIAFDEDQSCLLRCLGNKDRNEPEIYDYNLYTKPGDAFLLCSDGVWEYLLDEEILIDLLKAPDVQQWAEHLLLRIMDRIDGNNDNLSLLAVMIQP